MPDQNLTGEPTKNSVTDVAILKKYPFRRPTHNFIHSFVIYENNGPGGFESSLLVSRSGAEKTYISVGPIEVIYGFCIKE